jgi:hypothetical protein
MITRRLLHFLLAVAFFAAAIAAGMQMQNSVGENIATGFGNLFSSFHAPVSDMPLLTELV